MRFLIPPQHARARSIACLDDRGPCLAHRGKPLAMPARSRSNHLITEAVGLWDRLARSILNYAEANVWKNLGGHLLREAVLDQITPDGVSQQHSSTTSA